MKRIALLTIALLTATNAFAMSEQAKGSLDAAASVNYFGVVNKYCKFMTNAEFSKNFGYITDFAAEFRVQYPEYDITLLADKLDANLSKDKKEVKRVCAGQKAGFQQFYQKLGGWED